MRNIQEIRCKGCGQIRRWVGFVCLDTCPCLKEREVEDGEGNA